MPHSYIVKKTASKALKNNWAKSIIACFILLITMLFTSFLQELFAEVLRAGNFSLVNSFNINTVADITSIFLEIILLCVLIFPLSLGVFRYFWKLTDFEKIGVVEIFYYFTSKKLLFRAIKTFLMLFCRIFLIMFICLIPYVTVEILTSVNFYSLIGINVSEGFLSMDFINSWFLILGVFAGIVVLGRYFLVPAIITANDSTDVREAFKLSKKVASGYIGSFLTFLLSFAGWLLLSLFAFPLIFTLPYFLASFSEFSRTVIKINNLKAIS